MSDHFSGPAVMDDPSVDLTDFYAFPSPERSSSFVLIMNAFPMASREAFFSDAVVYRFRLRPLRISDGNFIHGTLEHTIDVRFNDVAEEEALQSGSVLMSNGSAVSFGVGQPFEHDDMRVFAGLVSDPFFMDVEAALRTDMTGKLAFKPEGTNTVQFRDVLSIVLEIPIAPIIGAFRGVTLIGAVAETIVPRFSKPIRIERLGRPEIKNFVLQNTSRDPHTKGIELRDLYNREDAFALSKEYGPLYESRLDANLAFFDCLDDRVAWPLGPDGRHPLRDLLLNDFLVLDLAHKFSPNQFLAIERAMRDGRAHDSCGGRWLEDDILDEMLTLYVNGGRGERVGDGVDAPTNMPSRCFPYLQKPNLRTDIPLPAFLSD